MSVRLAMIVTCQPCGQVWIGMYTPMPIKDAARVMKNLTCPMCAANSSKIKAGGSLWKSSQAQRPTAARVLVAYEDSDEVEITRGDHVAESPDLYPFWQDLPASPFDDTGES
jgi:hypothetical protein